MKTNEEIEVLILNTLRGGALTFMELCVRTGFHPSKDRDKATSFRSVDRAVQRLRKRGLVVTRNRRWELAS